MAQSRSEPTTHARPRRKAHPAVWIAIGALLAAVLAGTLWVPIYNRTAPALGGWPFFYWYQLLWVPVVALVSWCAYLLSKAARGGSGTRAAGSGPPGGGPVSPNAPGDAPPLPKRVPPQQGGG
jgi:Protein of unknown function (DUF3311)